MPQNLKVVYYVEPNAAALARHAAQFLVEQAEQAVAARGQARIAVSGGSTPKAAFEPSPITASPGGTGCRGTSSISTGSTSAAFRPDDPDSNYRMTREALLDHVPLKPEQIHRIEGELEPDDAAAKYEAELSMASASRARNCRAST